MFSKTLTFRFSRLLRQTPRHDTLRQSLQRRGMFPDHCVRRLEHGRSVSIASGLRILNPRRRVCVVRFAARVDSVRT